MTVNPFVWRRYRQMRATYDKVHALTCLPLDTRLRSRILRDCMLLDLHAAGNTLEK